MADTVLAMADTFGPRFSALVVLGAGTGMRRGELLGLTLDRIGFEFGTHESGLIFTPRTGPVSTGTLDSAWRRAAKTVGTDATPHDLRHYFASVHIAGATSITKLSWQLGHKYTSETLDTYGHLMGDESEHARQVMQAALTKPATAEQQ